LAVIAEAPWILEIFHNVLNGNALGFFSLAPWFHVSYLGALVFLVAEAGAIVIGLFITFREWKGVRDQRQRYGEKRGAS
jgi:hypothetical protein